jgi:transglutaminase-like putative cysteine protease
LTTGLTNQMLFEIDHLTRYRYTLPVRLGEHVLRFLPAAYWQLRLSNFSLEIDPTPVRREDALDVWGNCVHKVWFAEETDHLEIRAHLEGVTSQTAVATAEINMPLPMHYGNQTAAMMAFLEPLDDSETLRSFVQPLLANAAGDGLVFLDLLNQAVNNYYQRKVRMEGPPQSPTQTLILGKGVCRDLAILFMAACRHVGIAARFVSGYQQADGVRQLHYLHAWPEAYLPARGWVGYDPTYATRVGSDHVPVAAAPNSAAVAPVDGGYTFHGPELTSTLWADIRITTWRD